MEGAALLGRLTWQLANLIETVPETARVKTLALDVPEWPGHRTGQHVDVRLTAEDGYQARRSYSIASGPEDPELVLTVERLDEGEVSPYLVDELRAGDELELRGPIGGYFIWEEALAGPLLMVAGGSGVVPFRAMLRHHRAIRSTVPVRLLYSSRSLEDAIYREELLARNDVRVALTRAWPDDWSGHRGRRRATERGRVAPAHSPQIYICGPSAFVEAIAGQLVDIGHDPSRIRTERFGPTGA